MLKDGVAEAPELKSMGKRREVLVPGSLLQVPQPGRFHVRHTSWP